MKSLRRPPAPLGTPIWTIEAAVCVLQGSHHVCCGECTPVSWVKADSQARAVIASLEVLLDESHCDPPQPIAVSKGLQKYI
jgi:hypothetical protein